MNTLIRASAGSGKTYALTTRYLRLLRAGASPQTILATTFTRKAAGEILERVLKRLADAAAEEKALTDLRVALDSPDLSAVECRRLLLHLCRNLHRVSISTLDSFFHRLCRAFQLELGIPSGVTPVEQGSLADALLRRDALRATLTGNDLETMRDILNRLLQGKAARSVVGVMSDVASQLYELYREAPAEAWQRLHVPPMPSPAELDAAFAFLGAAASKAKSKSMARAIEEDLARARAAKWAEFLDRGLAAKLVKGETTYSRQPIDPEVADAYEILFQAAKATLLGELRARTEATYHLLSHFASHYDELRQRRGLMLFSDAPRALVGIASGCSPEEIAYRLDAGVEHLLLDEFQDTSPEQWAILRPFAQACTASESRSFFCVGDVKQAIYGWRGGSAEIFGRMEQDLAGLMAKSLDVSYRSSQVVLDAVNAVFTGIANNLALQEYPKVVATWGAGYNAHKAHRDLPGWVELVTFPAASDTPEEGDGEGEATDPLDYVARRVREVHTAAPQAEIGILMRTNAAVHAMLDALRREGVDASGEGPGRVDDDPAVELILSAMTLADHPGHSAAAFHVAHSPLAAALDAPTDLHVDAPCAARIARAIRRRLLVDGYGRVVADWARVLAEAEYLDRRNTRRLLQLIEMADAFDAEASLRPGEFVQYVRKTSIEDAATSQVRVMTIHRSKGLEFDAVFLPELHKRIVGQTPLVVIDRPSPTEPIRSVYRYPDKFHQLLLPELADVVAAHRSREVSESLCVLYVAMTRARHALYLTVPPLKPLKSGKPASPGLSHAAILRYALVPDGRPEGPAGGETLYAQGDPHWYTGLSAREEAAREAAAHHAPVRLKPVSGRPTRNYPRVTPSSLGKDQRVPVEVLFGSPARGGQGALDSLEGARYGTRLHRLLALVSWSDEPLPDDETLLRELRHALPDDTEAQRRRVLEQFHRLLAQPEVRGALARPKEASEVRLWRETPFSVLLDDGIVEGRFDRVVVYRDAEGLLRADLLDYKSDTLSSTSLEAAAEAHRPQVAAYARALQKMLGIPSTQVRAGLLFTAAGLCREVRVG